MISNENMRFFRLHGLFIGFTIGDFIRVNGGLVRPVVVWEEGCYQRVPDVKFVDVDSMEFIEAEQFYETISVIPEENMRDENFKLKNKIIKLTNIIYSLQWSGYWDQCPSCGNHKDSGHWVNCKLGNILKEG